MAASPTYRAAQPEPRRSAPAGSAICRHWFAAGRCRPRCAPWKNRARSDQSRAGARDRRSCPGTGLPRHGSKGSRRSRAWSLAACRIRRRRRRGFAAEYRRSFWSLSLVLCDEPRSKHSLAGLVEGKPAFRITDAPLQFAARVLRGRRRMPDNKNVLYLIIGVLLVAVGVLSYNLYQAKKQPEGFQINVGPDGLKIKGK